MTTLKKLLAFALISISLNAQAFLTLNSRDVPEPEPNYEAIAQYGELVTGLWQMTMHFDQFYKFEINAEGQLIGSPCRRVQIRGEDRQTLQCNPEVAVRLYDMASERVHTYISVPGWRMWATLRPTTDSDFLMATSNYDNRSRTSLVRRNSENYNIIYID